MIPDHVHEFMKKTRLLNCLGLRFPEKIGGNLAGVHYIRDVADADFLVSSLVTLLPLILSVTI